MASQRDACGPDSVLAVPSSSLCRNLSLNSNPEVFNIRKKRVQLGSSAVHQEFDPSLISLHSDMMTAQSIGKLSLQEDLSMDAELASPLPTGCEDREDREPIQLRSIDSFSIPEPQGAACCNPRAAPTAAPTAGRGPAVSASDGNMNANAGENKRNPMMQNGSPLVDMEYRNKKGTYRTVVYGGPGAGLIQMGDDNNLVIYSNGCNYYTVPGNRPPANPRPAASNNQGSKPATKPPRQIVVRNGTVTTNDMMKVASDITRRWRMVGRLLNVTDEDMDTIRIDFERESGITEVAYQMLRKWVNSAGKEATVKCLANALADANMVHVVEKHLTANLD